MKILVLHRIPYHKIDYARGIDHSKHDVTYIGRREILDTLPGNLRCEKVERPGIKSTAAEVLETLGTQRHFDSIISLSEYELLDAARLRPVYGAPGPTESEVMRVRDKLKMKDAVSRAGLRVPRNQGCSEVLDARESGSLSDYWRGKTVVKPIDGASSEGVVVFESRRAALDAVLSNRIPGFRAERYEMEEFVEGPILHIDGLVQYGKILTVLASQYLGTCLDFAKGQPLGSFQLDPTSTKGLHHWAQKVISAVGIQTGSFHLELILTDSGPVFLEIGARVGGADVVDTFELATGIHMPSTELQLLIASENKPIKLSEKPFRESFGWFVFPGHHIPETECIVSRTDSFKQLNNVVRWNELTPDQKLPRNITYQSREVPVAGILRASSSAQMETLMRNIFSTVKIDGKRVQLGRTL